MRAIPSAATWIFRAGIVSIVLASAGCNAKQDGHSAAAKQSAAAAAQATSDQTPPTPAPEPEAVAAPPEIPPPAPPPEKPAAKAPLRPEFTSHPSVKAWVGRPFLYQAALNVPGAFRLKVAKGPDSSMKAEKGRIVWTPTQAGNFPVILEALLPAASARDTGVRIQQGFTLTVDKVLTLSLKPLPAQADKGDTVVFDLRGSAMPPWATDKITVRFDFDGDGKWDTEALPLAGHGAEKHVFTEAGRFEPKVEARYGTWETREAKGAIAIVSSVTPVLKISPDTVEPGGEFTADVSESKADGRLAFFLDVDGDGKAEWSDSSGAAKAKLKAPASGVWQVKLRARNPMGQEGSVSAPLRVNARPKLEWRVRNPKENMAAAVDFKAHAKDADDSLRSLRINFTGDAKDWETRAAADSQAAGREWWVRLKHAYGKVGKYTASACATSADGREACQELKVEIFNAPPVCLPGPEVHATLGQPLQIDGTGSDPDGKIVKWEWDLNGDGKYDLASAENGRFQYTFSKLGTFNMVLRVTTADGMTAQGSRKVEVRKKWKS